MHGAIGTVNGSMLNRSGQQLDCCDSYSAGDLPIHADAYLPLSFAKSSGERFSTNLWNSSISCSSSSFSTPLKSG